MLTRAGGRLFESVDPTREKVKIHQFHEREVKVPGRDFVALAEDNQCLMNRANTILTFQGHPEMDAELSHLLFKETKEAGLGEEEREALRRKIEGEHDGQEVWKTIVRWASNV
jgi:GMP synthase-like glutamine amidotransferase